MPPRILRLTMLASVLGTFGFATTGRLTAAEPSTILYETRATQVAETLVEADELLVPAAEVSRVTGFELKPAGACRGELCIPLPQSAVPAVQVEREGKTWFSLTAFARRLEQPYVHDAETATWSFGEIPLVADSGLVAGLAPDFTLPDRQGKPVRLSDFRGKKVLILSWASW